MFAQLGFCQGNSGDPIFSETFGTGLNNTQLPPGTTTYSFANGGDPNDGFYTVSSSSNYFDWLNVSDHTPNDINGRMLIVNSDFTAGEFYKTNITGLCENTTYEFSSWLINLTPANGFCGSTQIPINVRFQIWDNTDTNLLASGDTGDIFGTNSPNWQQYALVFQTIPGQTSVILKMINNGSGGCGNDLAIDDIVFKSCGDLITTEDSNANNSVSLCSSESPFSETISAIPDNAVFNNHFYQWQISSDGTNWTDINGETNDNITVTGITQTTYYRAKVAEFQANLNNADCITYSDVYEINITQAPVQPTTECWETAIFDESICNWVVTGTQPAEPTGLECWETATFNDITCAWEVFGTQPIEPTDLECWETTSFNTTTCTWEISGTQPEAPTDLDCWQTANFNNATCTWEVTGAQPPEPTGLECWETTSFNTSTCNWEILGEQPEQPNLECWQNATFNDMSCTWEVSGIQPAEPTGLECWEIATFNDISCVWEVTGTQPEAPSNLECWQSSSFNVATCSWEVIGTQPQEPTGLECWQNAAFNDMSCTWEVLGVQPTEPTDLECWESTEFNEDSCEWEITGTQPLEFRDEFVSLCENDTVNLQAMSTIQNPLYQWDSGEQSSSINVAVAGNYEVEVTDGCFTEIITFIVSEIEIPAIENISSDGSSIIINLSTTGEYQYSLDGINYQFSNVFSNQPSGLYTVFVKSEFCGFEETQEYLHFYIPKFMTPNGDDVNDFFSINALQYFTSSNVYIFDRYGKLLFSAENRNINWDGTFNGNKLPSSDYWYLIIIEGQEFRGHFTLKR